MELIVLKITALMSREFLKMRPHTNLKNEASFKSDKDIVLKSVVVAINSGPVDVQNSLATLTIK